ncbi:MAG: glycosyltransferase [Bacteroidaceae bacterium]|nr:glycosyltransferase [Bacteroidaceae bacterium]
MNDYNIQVSVIIPIYNVEKYLQQAIESITSQTLKEIEIIAINDGSTDSSLDILTEQAKKDNRIRVISTNNNGLSITRNLGMHMASGEYIYFFDSDDILEKDTLENCYLKCKSQNLDFVFFDADCFTDSMEKDYTFNYQRTDKYEDKVYSGIEILRKQLEDNGYRSSACLSFIKKEYLKKENLFFYPQTLHEDELFTFLLYLKARRVSLLKKTFFHRRVRANSIMTSSFSIRNVMGYLTVCRELYKESQIYNNKKKEKALLEKQIRTLISNIYFKATTNLPAKELDQIRKTFIHEFRQILDIKLKIKLLFPSLYHLLRKHN